MLFCTLMAEFILNTCTIFLLLIYFAVYDSKDAKTACTHHSQPLQGQKVVEEQNPQGHP